MSYILDALKKSEQERNPDRVPGLETQHAVVSSQTKRAFPWPALLTAIVVINLAMLYYNFFYTKGSERSSPSVTATESEKSKSPDRASEETLPVQATQQSTTPQQEPLPVPKEQPASSTGRVQSAETSNSQPQINEPRVSSSPQATEVPIVKAPLEETDKSISQGLDYDSLPHLTEMPVSLQNQIPSLNFSTHIYVADGGSFVIINNRSLSEGMPLGNKGLTLEKIVSQGVIFSFRSRYFTLGSMESW